MKNKTRLFICALFLFFASLVNANILNLKESGPPEKRVYNKNYFFSNSKNLASLSKTYTIVMPEKRSRNGIFYAGVFSILFILFLHNLILCLYLKSKSYTLFLGCLFSWIVMSFCMGSYALLDSLKIGFSLSSIFASIFYIMFMRDLLDLKEDPKLNKLSDYVLIFLGIFFLSSPFFIMHTSVFAFVCGGSILFFMAPIIYRHKIVESLKIVTYAQCLFVIGIVLGYFFSEQSILIGGIFHFLLLSFAPLNKIKIDKDKKLKEEKDLSNLLEDVRYGLERSIEKRTREIKDLLDNMNSAVFAIGNDYKILNPVSKYSEKIFKKKIVGKKVSEVLYYNIKKGTKEYSDMVTVFSIIFGENDLQFSALSDNLPKKVQLPIDGRSITLKLSYAPILDDEGLVYKVLCIAEDVTGSEEYYLESSDSFLNLKFLKEISENENKGELANKLEYFVEEGFKILENFVSPLSDTYDSSYFERALMEFGKKMEQELRGLSILLPLCKDRIWEIIDIEERAIKIDPQIEATNIICDVLDNFLKYIGSASLFFKINFQLHDSLLDSVLEKIKDLETQFNNLFEYVFLVRKVHSIDEEKLKKVVQVAKLYPNFERSIDLIHQRARLVFFLLKGIGESELAQVYGKLASLVKLMPERSRLNESIIKNNLIEPFKDILEKTADIENTLPERVAQGKVYDEMKYLDLLIAILKRFVQEKEKGPNLKLPRLPSVQPFMLEFLKNSVESLSSKDGRSDAHIKETISSLEVYVEKIFKDELRRDDLLPAERKNHKFIRFLKKLLTTESRNKKAS